jgi:hypothetical protein
MALVSVVYMWSVFGSDQQADAPAAAAGAKAPDLRRVDAYRAFVDSPGVSPGPSHEYTARGIEHLAEAIRSVAVAHPVVDDSLAEQLAMFQQKADDLRANPSARDHADIVKDVFSAAADMLAHLQRTRRIDSPELETRIAALAQLARDVDGGEPLLQQQARVRKFFESSADVLDMLGRGMSIANARMVDHSAIDGV